MASSSRALHMSLESSAPTPASLACRLPRSHRLFRGEQGNDDGDHDRARADAGEALPDSRAMRCVDVPAAAFPVLWTDDGHGAPLSDCLWRVYNLKPVGTRSACAFRSRTART